MKRPLLTIALVAGLVTPVLAADIPAPKPAQMEIAIGSLTVGDKAPALTINKWVKGSEVSSFTPGKVTVVEFWATWCGPCKKSMAHLSELQKQYADKGVTIIGVTSIDSRGNTLGAVEKMTAEKGDTMGYTVAWDQDRQTSNAYMVAAAQPGIPTAFIVDQTGTIAWIGSPFEMDEPLAKIVAGKWDLAAAKSEIEPKQQANVGMMKFTTSAREKNISGMIEAGRKVLEANAKDGDTLNMIAWTIVDPARGFDLAGNPKLVALALEAAKKANDASGGKDPGTLDTLAWAYFASGDKNAAIATEKKAIELAKGDMKKELEESLAKFQK